MYDSHQCPECGSDVRRAATTYEFPPPPALVPARPTVSRNGSQTDTYHCRHCGHTWDERHQLTY